MNKKSIYTLLACIMLAGALAAQPGGEPVAGPTKTTTTSGEKKGWPSTERFAFITECIKEAKGAMSEDSARFYCYCMQERVEKKYPTTEAASKITAADMESPAFQKDIRECLGGTWDTKTRDEFLTECINTAKANIGEEKAKSYCECMLFKIEKAYPDSSKLGELTAEKLNSPEWKKVVQGCLDF